MKKSCWSVLLFVWGFCVWGFCLATAHAQIDPAPKVPPSEEETLLPDEESEEILVLEEMEQEDEIFVDPIDVFAPLVPSNPLEPTSFGQHIDLGERTKQGEELDEVIREQPGVSVRTFGSVLAPRQLSIRGSNSRQTLITLEGIRLNQLAGGSFDLSIIPSIALSAATLSRGAGALSQGSGAQGGTLALSLLSAKPTPSATLRGSVGSFGTYRGEGQLNGALQPWLQVGVGFSLLSTLGDHPFVDDQGTPHVRENNDGTRSSGFGSVKVHDGAGKSARLIQLVSLSERGAPGPSEFPERFAKARSSNFLSITGINGQLLSFFESPNWIIDLETRLAHRLSQRSYDNPTGLLGGQPFHSQHNEDVVEYNLTLTAEALEISTTRLFFDLRDERLIREGDEDPPIRDVVALTISEELRLFSERLRLLLGARYEQAFGDQGVWIPRAGLDLALTPWLNLKSNIARSYRLPSFDELYLKTEFIRGDPLLEPELTWQSDVGLVLRPLPWWRLEAVGFFLNHERLILFVPASALYYEARNLRGATSKGVEVSSILGGDGPFSLNLNYTWTHARFEAPPHDPLPGRPEHQAHARLGGKRGSWRGSLGVEYTGMRYLDSFGNMEEEARWWLDASLLWSFSKAWSLGVRGKNLLNVQDAVDALQQPLPGLEVMSSLTWRLSE